MIRRLPVLWQTLLLVLATLVAAQTINVALVMAMPSPRRVTRPSLAEDRKGKLAWSRR